MIKLAEAFDLLVQERSLIVHFSYAADGNVPLDQRYPHNLYYAITTGIDQCCSTVRPSDGGECAVGWIGIIGKPRDEYSILGADSHDAGAWREGCRLNVEHPNPAIDRLKEAISERLDNDYNEIVLQNFDVIGVYVHPTVMQRCIGRPPIEADLACVATQFPRLTVYSSNGREFVKFADGKCTPISVK